jgi:hypothetical protein
VILRPPGSRRLFTAEAIGTPYAVRIYETDEDRAAVLAFYDSMMHDWFSPFEGREDERARAYINSGQPVLVNVDVESGRTLVTLSEVGVRDDAPQRHEEVHTAR